VEPVADLWHMMPVMLVTPIGHMLQVNRHICFQMVHSFK
jgi:hypothetical protein